jgi:hypothetical protein
MIVAKQRQALEARTMIWKNRFLFSGMAGDKEAGN